MLDKGDIQKVQGRGASRTGLGTTDIDNRSQLKTNYVIQAHQQTDQSSKIHIK